MGVGRSARYASKQNLYVEKVQTSTGKQTIGYAACIIWDKILLNLTTVFVDTRLWKTKHLRKRFQNFRQSYVLSTCRIEIHQSAR